MVGTASSLDPGTLIGNAIDSVESGLGRVADPAITVAGTLTALWMAWRLASWLIGVAADMRMSDEDWDADARRHGYRDAADRARDHR